MSLRRKLETRNKKVAVEYKAQNSNKVGNMLRISKGQNAMSDRLYAQFTNIHANLEKVGLKKGLNPMITFLKVLQVTPVLIQTFEKEAEGYPEREKAKINVDGFEKKDGLENALRVFDAHSDVGTRILFVKTATILKMPALEKLLDARRNNPELVEGMLQKLKRAEGN